MCSFYAQLAGSPAMGTAVGFGSFRRCMLTSQSCCLKEVLPVRPQRQKVLIPGEEISKEKSNAWGADMWFSVGDVS